MRAAPEPEFAQDVLDVHFNRAFGNHQSLDNFVIAQPVCRHSSNLLLTGSEGVGSRVARRYTHRGRRETVV
jgi:hypothetical protein